MLGTKAISLYLSPRFFSIRSNAYDRSTFGLEAGQTKTCRQSVRDTLARLPSQRPVWETLKLLSLTSMALWSTLTPNDCKQAKTREVRWKMS